MKKYIKEITLLIVQLFMFYCFPTFAGPKGAILMVMIMISATFLFSLIVGVISNNKTKYLYPIITSVLFIPSIFIYYNQSALIHSIWYLAVASIGLLIGTAINFIFNKNN